MDNRTTSRRRRKLLASGAGALAAVGLGLTSRRTRAQDTTYEQPFINGKRNVVAFPEKRPLIVLTTRPPQLETPFEVFNEGILTPNDAFFVRYHNAAIPTSVDGDAHKIKIGGNAAGKPYEISVWDLRAQFHTLEYVAKGVRIVRARGIH